MAPLPNPIFLKVDGTPKKRWSRDMREVEVRISCGEVSGPSLTAKNCILNSLKLILTRLTSCKQHVFKCVNFYDVDKAKPPIWKPSGLEIKALHHRTALRHVTRRWVKVQSIDLSCGSVDVVHGAGILKDAKNILQVISQIGCLCVSVRPFAYKWYQFHFKGVHIYQRTWERERERESNKWFLRPTWPPLLFKEVSHDHTRFPTVWWNQPPINARENSEKRPPRGIWKRRILQSSSFGVCSRRSCQFVKWDTAPIKSIQLHNYPHPSIHPSIHPSKSKKTKKMHLQGSLLHTNPFEILSSFKTIFTVPSTSRRYKLAALATISLLATSRAKVPAQYRPIGSTLPSLKRSPRGFHRGRPVEPWRGVVNPTVWQPDIQGIGMDLDFFCFRRMAQVTCFWLKLYSWLRQTGGHDIIHGPTSGDIRFCWLNIWQESECSQLVQDFAIRITVFFFVMYDVH